MSMQYHSPWLALGSMEGTTRQLTPATLTTSQTAQANSAFASCLNASATFTIESGTPTGSYIVEQTNDIRAWDQQTAPSAFWNTIVSLPVTSGTFSGGGSSYLATWANGAKFTRIRWVATSGTGTGFVFVTGVTG